MRKSSGRPSLALRVRSEDQPGSVKKARLDDRRTSSNDNRPSISNFRGSNNSRLSTTNSRLSYMGKGKQAAGVGYNMYSTSLPKKRNSSSIGLRGRTDVPKDPRPITDRSYINKMIRMLCEFLIEKGYRHAISVKILHAPTSKDFYKIFEFLFSHLVPNYKVGKKPEEEIPKIFKLFLGYPFTLSKSSMFAIGSPHAWPNLLASLTWLVELIKSCEYSVKEAGGLEAIAFPHKEDDFDFIPEDRIIFEYVEQTYKAFLGGADEFDAYDEDLSRVLKNSYAGVDGGNEKLLAENRRLSEELTLLEKDPDRLKTLQEQRDGVQADGQRFITYLDKLKFFKTDQETKLVEVEEDLAALKLELETSQQKQRHMQTIYETQNLTPADVTRAKHNRQELQRQLASLERSVEDVDQDCWQIEVNIAKYREMMESKSNEYNKLCQVLKLIPVNAENAHGVDYEMKTAMSNTITHDFDSILMPALMQLKKQWSESLFSTESQKRKDVYLLEQGTELAQEAKEEASLLERTIQTTREVFESKKEITKREYEHALEESDAIQKEILECLKSDETNLQDALKDLRDTQKQFEHRKADMTRRKCAASVFLQSVVSEVVNHKELIQIKLQEVVDAQKQQLEKTRLEVQVSTSNS